MYMMDKKDKKKLCSQCEGSIPYQLTQCPFCGYEQQDKSSSEVLSDTLDRNRGLSSLYHPPYLSQSIGEVRKDKTEHISFPKEQESEQSNDKENELAKKEVIVILLLAIGGQFMLLGCILLLFSVDGIVTLQWKSKYWYIYCLFSVPFLILGFKLLKKFKQYS